MKKEIKKIHLTTVDSTQTHTKKFFPSIAANELLCIDAELQTGGKATHQRQWHSPKGGLYFTVCFSLKKDFPHLANLSQVMALSVLEVLASIGFTAFCKWPNDLVLHQKKVAGILTEVQTDQEKSMVYIGVGLNVNVKADELEPIDQEATSLYVQSKREWNIQELLDLILRQFHANLSLLETEGYKPFIPLYEKHLLHLHEEVVLVRNEIPLAGVITHIASDGRPVFKSSDGEVFPLQGEDRFTTNALFSRKKDRESR